MFKWAIREENRDKEYISSLINKKVNSEDSILHFHFLITRPIYLENTPTKEDKSKSNNTQSINKFVGFVALTIDLQEMISEFLPQVSSYATKEHTIILDDSGSVLFHTYHPKMIFGNIHQKDKACLKCHNSFNNIEKILVKKEGTTEYTINNELAHLASFNTLEFENIKWTVILSLHPKEITGFIETNLIITIILIGIVTLSLAGGFIIIYRSNRLKIIANEGAKRLREKQKLEDERDASALRFLQLVETSPDAIVVHCDGKIVFANSSTLVLAGVSNVNDILGKPAIDFVHPDDRDKAKKRITEVLISGKPAQTVEERFIRTDGTVIEVEVTAVATTHIDKPAVQVVIHDISERKRAELERQVIYEITHGITSTANLDELLKLIHSSLKNIMYADNCFVALYDEQTKLFSFPYWVDKFDPIPEPLEMNKSCSAYVLRSGKPLLFTQILFDQLLEKNEVELVGTNSPSWVGVPLITPQKTIGVLVLQHYEEENVYSERDVKILDSIGSQVAIVIERKQAEEELRESEERYRELVEGSPDAIAIYAEGKILFVNSASVSLMRAESAEALIGMSVIQFVSPDYREFVAKRMMEAMKSEKALPIAEEKFLRFDGSEVDVEVKAIPVIFKKKQAVQIIVRDITERKLAEKALTESETRYKLLFEKNPQPMWVYDPETLRFLTVNESAVSKYGYTKEEFLSMTLKDIRPSEEIPRLLNYVSELKNQVLTSRAWRHKLKDGNMIFVEIQSNSIEYDGKPARIVLANDITERLISENEIISQKNRFSQLFENSPLAISLLDSDDKIVNINESFSTLFGFNLEEIKGKCINDLIVLPEYSDEAKNYSEQLRAGNQVNKESYRKKKDGSLVYVQIVGIPVIENEKIASIFGLYVDLTERKEAEDQIALAKELAELSDRMKSEFLAQMSHEIRTPLNGIVGSVGCLTYTLSETDPETQTLFDNINSASRRIIRTVDLILNMSEVQASSYQPYFVEVDLNSEILMKLYNEHQLMANQKELEFLFKWEEKESKVFVDEYSIVQIFSNLIDNAIKFTPKGKVEIFLGRNNNGNIIVEVKDTGVGISKKFFPRLFESFSQEEQGYSRAYEGNGLGLALVKRYCDINNVTIEVESQKNVGSTFRIIFAKK